MEKKKAAVIEGHIRSALEQSQEWGADIFGIGRKFHQSMPGRWKEMQENWKELYRELEVEIRVESSIRRIGIIERAPFYQYHVDIED